MKSALEKLDEAYPEAAKEIRKIVDMVFTPNELWRQENYADKFFGELASRIDGLAAYARQDLLDHGIEVTTENMKEAAVYGKYL